MGVSICLGISPAASPIQGTSPPPSPLYHSEQR